MAVISSQGIDELCSILLSYLKNQFANLESSPITETDFIAKILRDKGKIKILRS